MSKIRIAIGHDADFSSQDARMSVDVFYPPAHDPQKIAFAIHGRNGSSDSLHMMRIIDAYLENDYLVLSPNLCNSQWNDSAGEGTDFTIAHHIRDTERTIEWAKGKKAALGWEGDRFSLAGHSMGGYAAAFLAATAHGSDVSHILSVASFTSGDRLIDARIKYHPNGLENLQIESPNALTEWPGHSVYDVIGKITMPVTAIVGIRDNLTLPSDIRDFFEALPNGREYKVIDGEHHCLVGDGMTEIFSAALRGLEEAALHRRAAPQTYPHPSP